MDDKTNDTLPEDDKTSATSMLAKPWAELINDAQKVFAPWHDRCDRAKENYASLKKLANENGSREMQLMYANMEVLKPTIYARKPIPVCKPRFTDRKPVPRAASELIERCLLASFDAERVHDRMLGVRDDVVLYGRGVIWARYKTEGGEGQTPDTKVGDDTYGEAFGEYVCYDHINRKDFLHEPVRDWLEVGWVARRVWLTAEKGRARFGDRWKGVHYVSSENDTDDEYKVERKAEVWELWHKGKNVVVWLHPKGEELLDMREPWLTLDGFFPCPKPAYAVCEPETLIPVPEYLFYRDQLEEVNTLTGRIGSLAEALRLKGFYSAGAEEVGTAVEKAFQSTDDNAILIPVPTVSALGQGMKDAIMWMPLVDVANTIQALIALRKQVIEDIYQISGISDIMRGETQASETATAQNIKAQFGSVRVRSRQEEMIRIADDLMMIAGEIMAENFQPQTMVQMAQMEKLVPAQLIQQHEALKRQQAQQAQMMQQAQQQPPQPGQPPMAPPQMPPLPQLPPLPREAVAIEEVFGLLRDQKMRPFVLQTASDSTIQPNEDNEKQRRNEFAQAVGNLMVSAGPIVQAAPEAATLVGEMLRFVSGAYRAGRDMEQTIDDFVAKVAERAAQPPQPPPPDPKIELAKMDAEDKKAEREARMQERQMAMQAKQQEDGLKRQQAMEDRAMKQEDARLKAAEAQQKAQSDAMMKTLDLKLKEIDVAMRQLEIVATAEQAEQTRRVEREKAEQDEYREAERGMMSEQKERQATEQSARREQAQENALSMVAEGLAAIADAQRTLSESLTRPKTIKFNEQGRPVGIQ
jgi:hypothetical protein